jgi:hypothetical protein
MTVCVSLLADRGGSRRCSGPTEAESCHLHKDLRPLSLMLAGIFGHSRVASEVDEQLLGGPMRLPHGRRDGFAPIAVEVAEPAVAVAVCYFFGKADLSSLLPIRFRIAAARRRFRMKPKLLVGRRFLLRAGANCRRPGSRHRH